MRVSNRLAHGLLIIIAVILSVYFLRETSEVFMPFVTAAVLSFFAYPLVTGMEKKGIPMGMAIMIVVLGLVVLIAALGMLIHFSVISLVDNFPRYESRLLSLANDFLHKFGFSTREAAKNFGSEVTKQTTTVAGIFGGVLGTTLSIIESILLVLVYLVFFLMGRRSVPQLLDRAFGNEKRTKMMTILREVEAQSLRYIGLRTLLCVVTGFVAWVILQLFGVEFALLFGVITFVAQYVPFIGPIVASIAPILIALIQFDTPINGLWVGALLTVWHLIVGYFVEPRVFGKGMHLSQALVLLGLIFFAWLWGAAGAVLAVPLLVIAKSIFDNIGPLRPAAVILGGE